MCDNRYRECCWAYPQRDLVNKTDTCMSTHAGATVGAVASQRQDPSSEGFCQLATGTQVEHGKGKGGVCHAYDGLDVFDMETCYASFCNSGVRGFKTFLYKIFQWAQSQIMWFLAMGLLIGTADSVIILSSFTLLFIESRACERIGMIQLIEQQLMKKSLKDGFDKIDKDGSGQLSLLEFKLLLAEIGASDEGRPGYVLTEEDYEAEFVRLDDDNSGSINFKEFEKWWDEQDAKVKETAMNASSENAGMVRKDDIKRWVKQNIEQSALGYDFSITADKPWPATTGGFSRDEWSDGCNFLAILNAHKDFEDETPDEDDAISDERLKELLSEGVDSVHRLRIAFDTARKQFGTKEMISPEQLATENGWNSFLDSDGSGSVSRKERKAAEMKLEVTLMAYIAALRQNIARLALRHGKPLSQQDRDYAQRNQQQFGVGSQGASPQAPERPTESPQAQQQRPAQAISFEVERSDKQEELSVDETLQPPSRAKSAVAPESMAEVSAMFDHFDSDHSGTVSQAEAIQMIHDEYTDDTGQPLLNEKYIVGAWSVFDINKDGVLSVEEFARFFTVVRSKAQKRQPGKTETVGNPLGVQEASDYL